MLLLSATDLQHIQALSFGAVCLFVFHALCFIPSVMHYAPPGFRGGNQQQWWFIIGNMWTHQCVYTGNDG